MKLLYLQRQFYARARECSLTCERAGWNERRMTRENCLCRIPLVSLLRYLDIQSSTGTRLPNPFCKDSCSIAGYYYWKILLLLDVQSKVIRINKIDSLSFILFFLFSNNDKISYPMDGNFLKISPIQRYLVETIIIHCYTTCLELSNRG